MLISFISDVLWLGKKNGLVLKRAYILEMVVSNCLNLVLKFVIDE